MWQVIKQPNGWATTWLVWRDLGNGAGEIFGCGVTDGWPSETAAREVASRLNGN